MDLLCDGKRNPSVSILLIVKTIFIGHSMIRNYNFIGMRKTYLVPNEYRKLTTQHLEQAYAALSHLISLCTLNYKHLLVGFAGILYSRITYLFQYSASDTISELKLVRRWFIEFVRDGELGNPGLSIDRWSDQHGCPELLVGLESIWDEIYDENNAHRTEFFVQTLFSILSLYRVIVVPAKPNHTTITNEPTFTLKDLPTASEIAAALSRLGITPSAFMDVYANQVHSFDWEILSTRGPNGDATWTAHLDSRAWSMNTDLLSSLRAFLEESNLSSVLRALIGTIDSLIGNAIPNLTPILGKLAYIEEWGGKCRIVAQLDYWTQMAMTPLHNTINHFLKSLKQDGTFNQQGVCSQVRSWTQEKDIELNCFDLSNATDRIPIEFQRRILSYLFGSASLAQKWAEILVGREFLASDGSYLHYATGQPMGARSSFPMLALTHHVIIQIAAIRAEVKDYSKYVVVGDDSTLTNNLVSTEYLTIMRVLGVPVNLTKSIQHVANSIPTAEICNRVFMDGVEISMFNIKLLVNTIRDGRLAPDLQNDLHMRGWRPEASTFWLFMAGILDRDNLTSLIKLNVAPLSITGLLAQVKPDTKIADLANWLPGTGFDLQPEHLVELFTYVAASEALKRLDSILRGTVTINDALAMIAVHSSNPGEVPQFVRDAWLTDLLTDDERTHLEEIIIGAGPITPTHPIVLASRSEANRVSELLHSLNSLEPAMVARARLGLLDVFRTSVSTIWLDSNGGSAAANRALFVRMLNTLISLFTSHRRITDGSRNLQLNYSVVLTTINRLWSVSLVFGSTVAINSLRSGVTRNVNAANETLDTALKSISILPSIVTPEVPGPELSARGKKRRRFLRKDS